MIRSIVIVAYVGWAAYTSISVFPSLDIPPASAVLVDAFTLLIFCGSAIVFWMQNSPWTLYLYVAFPCYFWREFYLRGAPTLLKTISKSSFSSRQLCIYGLLVVVSLQSMVVCASLCSTFMVCELLLQAAYTYRAIWSVGFVIIGILWPYCSWSPATLSQNCKLALKWAFSCLVTAVFPLLPVDKKESLSTVYVSSIRVCVALTSF